MPTLRDTIPYTLANLSATVSATAFQGLEDAITHLHQRGKVVLCAVGNNTNGVAQPLSGVGNAGMHFYIPRDHSVVFQVPSGYNRFSLAMGLHFPFVLGVNNDVYTPVSAVGFRHGGTFYPIYQRDFALQTAQTVFADGKIPIPPTSGNTTQMAISMAATLKDESGEPITQGTTIMSNTGGGYGFYYLCMSVYRDEQC